MLALGAVAQGAFRLGQKLFQGIKTRKDKKQAKRAAKTAAENLRISELGEFFKGKGVTAGSTTITSSGNILAKALGQPSALPVKVGSPSGVDPNLGAPNLSRGENMSPAVLVGIAVGGFVLLKALKIIK